MALKLLANPTFRAKVDIPLPGGEKASFVGVFKHRTADELREFSTGDAARERTDLQTAMEMLVGWEEVEADFSEAAVAQMLQQFHAAARVLGDTYVRELMQARLGN